MVSLQEMITKTIKDYLIISRDLLELALRCISGYSINFLVVVVGQRCSLKCRDCANFSPYAQKENMAYDVDSLISTLDKILGNIRKIRLLQIQGGEPFVYPYLGKLIDYLLLQEKIEQIVFATNGTVIPVKYLEKLSHPKISVRISNYPVVPKEKINSLCEVFDDSVIQYSVYNFVHGDSFWTKCGGIETPKEYDNGIVSDRYFRCGFKTCLTLENGILGKCSRAIHAKEMQKFTPKKNDYVSVTERHLKYKLIKYEFIQKINRRYFMEACRYCYGTELSEKVTPAIQLNDSA